MPQETASENNSVSNEDIYKLLQTINTNHLNIEKRLERIEINLGRDVKEVQSKLSILEEENKILKKQLLDTQKRQKKFNIVIYGIDEKEADLYSAVQEIINTKLEIQCEPIELRDIHRLGKAKQTNKNRPVLVELISYKKKVAILKNGHKLKGTGVFISNDLTAEELKEKKILLLHLKQAREKKYNAKIYKNKLIVNGETYGIEDLQGIDQLISEIGSDVQEIPALSKRNSSSTPSTPTYCQTVDITKELKEQPGYSNTEERNVRYLRSNVPNVMSNPKSADKKRLNTDKEDKENKKRKN